MSSKKRRQTLGQCKPGQIVHILTERNMPTRNSRDAIVGLVISVLHEHVSILVNGDTQLFLRDEFLILDNCETKDR